MKPVTKADMMRFRAKFHREEIDASERAIEHHKSMMRNHKAAIKAINKELYGSNNGKV